MYLSVASMLPQPLVSAHGFIGVISADEEWYIFACHIQMSPVSSTYFYELVHMKTVLMKYAINEDAGETAQMRRLARIFVDRTPKVWKQMKTRINPHWIAAHSCLKNDYTEDKKNTP